MEIDTLLDGQNLGRLASKVAILIRGKHKPNFTPHVRNINDERDNHFHEFEDWQF